MMNNIEELKRFIYSATVTSGSGSQSFYIDAKNREEADKRAANNESDGMYADDSEVTDLDALEYEDETTVDDFGDFPVISREQSLIAQLEAKNIRADACVNAFEGIETERFAGKSIGEFLAGEVILNKAEPKPDGSFGFTFSGLAIQIMAESFADQFKSSGAVNYLELLFDHSEVGPLTVTMQRVDGLTPAQKLATAEAALSAANEKLSKAVLPPRVEGILKQWQFERDCEWIESIKAAGFTVEGE
ncbi:hypothetical protein OU757_004597 [Yersinia enterocolitica]|nr:hypothetical protein [Yersinia enterocolitica]EKN3769485.1 hypothetical protein [Yersinia enterocolitica]HEA9984568.1 hypothetical protein [Yersinia enterocolitica]HEN3273071.1 hypothetical protein [Yersinia enterocolitica]